MVTPNVCPSSLSDDHVRAVTLDYADLSQILDAGYRRAVALSGDETAHFAVVKTCGEVNAVRSFLAPFCGGWDWRSAGHQPTIVVVALRMAAHGGMDEYLSYLHSSCSVIVSAMKQSAGMLGLEAYAHVHRPVSVADYHEYREQCAGLRIPVSFIPLGVFGAAYPAR